MRFSLRNKLFRGFKTMYDKLFLLRLGILIDFIIIIKILGKIHQNYAILTIECDTIQIIILKL